MLNESGQFMDVETPIELNLVKAISTTRECRYAMMVNVLIDGEAANRCELCNAREDEACNLSQDQRKYAAVQAKPPFDGTPLMSPKGGWLCTDIPKSVKPVPHFINLDSGRNSAETLLV